MILRLFLICQSNQEKVYVFEEEVTILNDELNIIQIFHSSIGAIIGPLFKNGTFQFQLESIEYWTQINKIQQFVTINIPIQTNLKNLPPLIKLSDHHILDLHVQYSM